MRTAVNDKIYTVEEYIQEELASETRHEFINGQLYEMAGEKRLNNIIAGFFYLLFVQSLKKNGFFVCSHDVKVAIPGGRKYYYPDVFATREESTEENTYIQYEPEIIVEVVSESTHLTDYVDKFIDYSKIPSLLYYLVVEPEITLITVHEKDGNNTWVTHKYTQPDARVSLSKLGVEFLVKQVYE
jgi:Uma2 family endonuclease